MNGDPMQTSDFTETDDWAMSERRQRAVMRGVPEGAKPKAPPADDYKFPTGRGVLSKAEIQALLRPDIPTINEEEPTTPAATAAPLKLEEDFGSGAHSVSAEARQIAARLSLSLGQMAGLKAGVKAEQASRVGQFSETLAGREMGPGSACVCFARRDGDISHLLYLPASMTHALITHACGGKAGDTSAARSLSAIDSALLEQLVAPLSSAFAQGARLAGIEMEPDYVASILPVQSGEEIRFSVTLPGQGSEMSLVRFDNAERTDETSRHNGPQKKPVTAVLTARIASLSVPVSRLSNLKPGDTLLLGLPADQPVELLSGGRQGVPAFEGDIGRKGGNMAIRVRRVCQD